MISDILSDIGTNFLALPGMSGVAIGYAEARHDQAGPRRLLMYPVRGIGKGPNFYSVTHINDRMVRKRLVTVQFECWGNPDPTGNLVKNTDDAELMLGSLVNAINATTPGGYTIQDEVWNSISEVMMNGRVVVLRVAFEIPIAQIDPNTTLALITGVAMTGQINLP